MKKFLSFALVALTALVMSGCGAGGSSNYKQGDPMPSIDSQKGTVNGRKYNNKDTHCYKLTYTYSVKSNGSESKVTDVTYDWTTEFDLVSGQEMLMWTAAQTGTAFKGSYSYIITTDSDYDSCVDHNNE